MTTRLSHLAILAGLAAALAAAPASASLVLVAPQDFGGSGLGTVNTVLTISSPRGSAFEAGSVGREVGMAVDVIVGDAMTGASQTQTRSLGALGVASANDLRVVFNAVEPGGSGIGITLADLQLSIFSPTGALLFNSGAFASVVFADTFSGAGNSGFVFGLDGAGVLAAQASAFGTGFAANLVGLSARASDAAGGPETFFIARGGPTLVAFAVPEPASFGLAIASLGLMGFFTRRRPG